MVCTSTSLAQPSQVSLSWQVALNYSPQPPSGRTAKAESAMKALYERHNVGIDTVSTLKDNSVFGGYRLLLVPLSCECKPEPETKKKGKGAKIVGQAIRRGWRRDWKVGSKDASKGSRRNQTTQEKENDRWIKSRGTVDYSRVIKYKGLECGCWQSRPVGREGAAREATWNSWM